MAFFREFILIVIGGHIGAVLGLGFGALIGYGFPHFIHLLAHPFGPGHEIEMAAAMGMICGLPLGAAAMAAGRLVGAVRHWAGLRDPSVAKSRSHTSD